MVPPRKVSLRLSQSGRALARARDAGVLWHDTSATPATPTDRYTNHNSLYRGYPSLLLVIIVLVLGLALRDHVSFGVMSLRSLGLRT